MTTNDRHEQSLTVHLAGNDYLTGVALAQLFSQSGFIDVTGFSRHGAEAVACVRSERPDVVLVDASITDGGLDETTAAICRTSGGPKVAILSTDRTGDSGRAMDAAFAAGASSYIVRDSTVEDIAAALRIVHRGGLVNAVFPACRHAPSNTLSSAARAPVWEAAARWPPSVAPPFTSTSGMPSTTAAMRS